MSIQSLYDEYTRSESELDSEFLFPWSIDVCSISISLPDSRFDVDSGEDRLTPRQSRYAFEGKGTKQDKIEPG
jgi:hypothetical protein